MSLVDGSEELLVPCTARETTLLKDPAFTRTQTTPQT